MNVVLAGSTLDAALVHAALGAALFAISALACRQLARLRWMLDLPKERSLHDRPIPRSGGLAILLTFLLGVLLQSATDQGSRIAEPQFLAFLASAMMMGVVSLIDDLVTLDFPGKLSAQIFSAAAVVPFGLAIHSLPVPFVGMVEIGAAGYLFATLWIVALTNAFNFMDGVDGLAAGQAVIAGIFWGLTAFLQGSHFSWSIAYIVTAALSGFLLHNFPRARIFMGDTGSQFLGFTFAVLAVIGARHDAAPLSLMIMPLLFFNVIWDTFYTFVRRLLRGAQVTRGHHSHLYQLLIRSGSPPVRVTLFHYAVAIAQGLGALVLIHLGDRESPLVFIPFVILQLCYTAFVLRRARIAGLEVDR